MDGIYLGLRPGHLVIVEGERVNLPKVIGRELGRITLARHTLRDLKGDTVHTRIFLDAPLRFTYVRETVKIYANVVPATHGETVRQVLGSGDAGRGFQRFALAKSPLTHLPAPTPAGVRSTLAVRTRLEWTVTVLRVPEDGKEFFKKLTDAGASQDALRGPAQMTFKDATPAAGTTPAVPAVLFESLDSRKLGETSLVPKLAAWTVASRDPGAKKDAPPVDPALDCHGVARGGFTGLENQLYRIEVHAGGKFDETNKNPTVTLKWSRDNGSIAYPFKDMTLAGTTCTVTLTANFRDDGRAVVKNNWVEVLAANASGGILLQVASVETTRAGIKLAFSTKGLSENGLVALAKMTKDVGPPSRVPNSRGRFARGIGQDDQGCGPVAAVGPPHHRRCHDRWRHRPPV